MNSDIKKEKTMGWFDCSALIVGIMLGTGIFVVFPKLAAAQNPSVFMIILSWFMGAFIAWCGAMCFAELASIFPQNGGDYVYLREGFKMIDRDTPVSFLFAWAQIFIIRPASLVSLAIVLAMNCNILIRDFFGASKSMLNLFLTLISLGSIGIFTLISMRGITLSKWTQNILSILKMLCLSILLIFGFIYGAGLIKNLKPLFFLSKTFENGNFIPVEGFPLSVYVKHIWMSLIPIMWVFGGWNEAPYIAGEMKNPTINIPKGLTLGIISLSILYLLTNLVYMLHLGPEGLAQCWTPASDLMKIWFGPKGEILMASLIIISSSGAINGLIFTGGRMTISFADDFLPFRFLLRTHPRYHTPMAALLFNAIMAFIIAFAVECKADSIDKLLTFTSGVVWIFFAMVVVAVLIFRKRLKNKDIPFKVPFYPFTPILFLIMCMLMIWGALEYDKAKTLWGIGVLVTGIPVYYLTSTSFKIQKD
ncbi:MAG: amino acid permease [Candidatus Aureabacteria bacterium]|nr:amino acid permease [Candidatus Auribacterota bacterium]